MNRKEQEFWARVDLATATYRRLRDLGYSEAEATRAADEIVGLHYAPEPALEGLSGPERDRAIRNALNR